MTVIRAEHVVDCPAGYAIFDDDVLIVEGLTQSQAVDVIGTRPLWDKASRGFVRRAVDHDWGQRASYHRWYDHYRDTLEVTG